jgi:16S rRNA (cytosine967-C5)-methyltransferase
MPLGVELELPDWVVEVLSQTMAPQALRKLALALSEPAPLDLRVNELRSDRDKALAQLAAHRIPGDTTPFSPMGIRLRGKPAINRCPLFVDGTVEIQDEGSQLIGYLVNPVRGEMVVDFCAGAGGKTLALAAMMRSTGRVYAFDNDEKRLARFKPRLARSGLSNVHPQRVDGERDPRIGRLAGKIDRVLVDAPCSGLGTLRRNPDLKWRHSPQSVEELHAKQLAIVNAAARLVKPGGRLVYATCSLLPRENEAVVAAFLSVNPAFRVADAYAELARRGVAIEADGSPYLRLYPHVHYTDGFFAAVLDRVQ